MKRGNVRAFSLIELLAGIGILAILATFLSLVVTLAQDEGKKADCLSRIRRSTVALNLSVGDGVRKPVRFNPDRGVVGDRRFRTAYTGSIGLWA